MNDSEILFYQAADGKIKIAVGLENETVWLSHAHMAGLFSKAKSPAISISKTFSPKASWLMQIW